MSFQTQFKYIVAVSRNFVCPKPLLLFQEVRKIVFYKKCYTVLAKLLCHFIRPDKYMYLKPNDTRTSISTELW